MENLGCRFYQVIKVKVLFQAIKVKEKKWIKVKVEVQIKFLFGVNLKVKNTKMLEIMKICFALQVKVLMKKKTLRRKEKEIQVKDWFNLKIR